MQPDRPSPADALRILKRLKKPAAAKFDGRKAHRRFLTLKPERGLVAIMGPNGLFYANAVGALAPSEWSRQGRIGADVQAAPIDGI